MRIKFYTAIYILTFILLCSDAAGSPIRKKNWDRILDRYEMLCNECIDMKHRVDAGERIPTKDLSKLLNSLGEIRNNLRNGGDSMTSEQIARFDRIRDRYNAVLGSHPVKTTISEDVAASEDNAANGEVVPTAESDSKRSIAMEEPPVSRLHQNEERGREPWYAIPQMAALEAGIEYPGMQYKYIAQRHAYGQPQAHALYDARQHSISVSISALASVLPDTSFGIMAGISGGEDDITGGNGKAGWGVYVKYMSNFKSAPYSYECYSNGNSTDGSVWLSGNSRTALRQLSLGVTRGIIPHLEAFAGIGYGRYTTTWEDNQGQWILVKDSSTKGMLLEAGLSCTLYPLYFTAGVSTTAFQYTALFLGLGLRF